MKKSFFFKLLPLVLCLILTACSNQVDTPTITNSSKPADAANPFETNESETKVLGSLGHGLYNPKTDENGKPLPLQYDGGEFQFDYEVHASGDAKNVGFLLFVDGIPQPYKINTSNSSYEYTHIFNLEKDDEEVPFKFIFTPVTGKKDDVLDVSVVSIYNPSFIPDMVKTVSYGGYQELLDSIFSMRFNKDADVLDKSLYPHQECLSNLKFSSKPVTNDFITSLSALSEVTTEVFNSNIFNLIYYDGNTVLNNLKVSNSKPLHITFKLCGMPGAEYKNIFYINHQPVSSKDGISFKTKISKGTISIIDVDIDLKKLDDFNTSYVVSVPTNSKDLPDDPLSVIKTQSVLLYK